ncbi:RNA-binding region-containing protein 3 [Condylostylus longicornis]|uniref:RNA-binding region-containing protein 3 n=1 Tax=Condylostylus longicornis TaxID=2530218 RepID=UPI00244D995E|nr:RNA-binding region-containing protein 3 [Condylostylus longicornis]
MDYETLIVKNIPKSLKLAEYFKKNHNAIAARYYGRARAVVRFNNKNDAKIALTNLHQSEINKHIISAEYLGRRKLVKPPNEHVQENMDEVEKNLPDFAKKLLSMSSIHGFNHPPPPHLVYCYPKINRDILDAISISLLSNSKFYVQVLHLMNRMNLEPPFLESKRSFVPPGELKHVQTQTDFERMEKLLESDESEIESSDDGEPISKRLRIDKSQLSDERIKLRLKKVLKSQNLIKKTATTIKHNEKTNIFEPPEKDVSSRKISLNVASVKLPIQMDTSSEDSSIKDTGDKSDYCTKEAKAEISNEKELTIQDLKENKIPEIQLKEMTVYKSYQIGEQNNKLYIKNLNKHVTIEDLKRVFKLFVTDIETELEIKLMQQGRMKGQAFVSFLKVNEDNMEIMHEVINLTNGFILKNKPMIVCFAKK